MKKKERTSDEKTFDGIIKNAIKRLGPNPAPHEEPTPFPYVMYWDRLGRKGQRCRIIHDSKFSRTVQVVFEDGTVTVINSMAIRRI
jgi:hypothetical protein